MDDTWERIQAGKGRNSIREKLQMRIITDRQQLLNNSNSKDGPSTGSNVEVDENSRIEILLLEELASYSLNLPTYSVTLVTSLTKRTPYPISHSLICNLLKNLSSLEVIETTDDVVNGESVINVISVDQKNLVSRNKELKKLSKRKRTNVDGNQYGDVKRLSSDNENLNINGISIPVLPYTKKYKESKNESVNEILSLISTPTTREKENKKISEEIMELLNKPTTKERSLNERFRSQGGTQVRQFCCYRTRIECITEGNTKCEKLHFTKIIAKHTEESLGDCSYLNTCFHTDTCKYVHYEVDKSHSMELKNDLNHCIDGHISLQASLIGHDDRTILYPPQWVQCDLRFFDTSVLGKFSVVMADPPWDIHMELPYGTLSDDEMRRLGVPNLQDDGVLFLWVTGRAMELGRECLSLWGYEYIDELVWVKTNQLQRIIRTGRTGHWLNHGKEHCLVGLKGNPKNLNRGLDCDVIVSEVRDTSHKPDEIYGIIERLSPGTRKIELFGRAHNVQPNWITLGNQVDGINIVDPDIIRMFNKRYPDGYSITRTKR